MSVMSSTWHGTLDFIIIILIKLRLDSCIVLTTLP